jgi:hypothetical protein
VDCEQAGLFGLREEAEHREGGEKGRQAVAEMIEASA